MNLLRLTEGMDSDPVWSPDGDAIAFVRDDFGNYDIYLLKPEEDEDWRGEVIEERWLKSDQEEAPVDTDLAEFVGYSVSVRETAAKLTAAEASRR